MTDRIKTFWVEPAGRERVWLRRYVSGSSCPLPWGYHNESNLLVESRVEDDESTGMFDPSKDDPRWPTHCDCGYAFRETDPKQLFTQSLYNGAPDGQLYTLRDVPAGAMWDATWLTGLEPYIGPDGIALHVKLPDGHDWHVDGEASNCTMTHYVPKVIDGIERAKVWSGRTHYCWVRRGDPRTGFVHVDKGKPGESCRAGAGSILTPKWHGFLHEGYLSTDG